MSHFTIGMRLVFLFLFDHVDNARKFVIIQGFSGVYSPSWSHELKGIHGKWIKPILMLQQEMNKLHNGRDIAASSIEKVAVIWSSV